MSDLSPPTRADVTEFFGMITTSDRMRALFDLMQRVARSEAPVLVRGATGTGKELVARALHQLSPRAGGPLRAINCATLTPELLASELFGHLRGAFTGAVSNRQGLFALSHRGSVFLDEIAEMPLEIQARLLRVLQDKTFVPLGGSEAVEVDVRVLSATNKALRNQVEAGLFREDLMYRVRVVPLFLPRLVDREGDVEALTWHFIAQFNRRGARRVEAISADSMELLLGYPFPGNVRELHNLMEYAYAVGRGPLLTPDEFPPELRGEPPPDHLEEPETAQQQERRVILQALRQSHGRRGEAARVLGMSRTTLWRKIREHQI